MAELTAPEQTPNREASTALALPPEASALASATTEVEKAARTRGSFAACTAKLQEQAKALVQRTDLPAACLESIKKRVASIVDTSTSLGKIDLLSEDLSGQVNYAKAVWDTARLKNEVKLLNQELQTGAPSTENSNPAMSEIQAVQKVRIEQKSSTMAVRSLTRETPKLAESADEALKAVKAGDSTQMAESIQSLTNTMGMLGNIVNQRPNAIPDIQDTVRAMDRLAARIYVQHAGVSTAQMASGADESFEAAKKELKEKHGIDYKDTGTVDIEKLGGKDARAALTKDLEQFQKLATSLAKVVKESQEDPWLKIPPAK